jgi:hypothetical protein
MELTPNNPVPGIYYDVPMSLYRQTQAVNHSTLRHIDRSPAHFAWAAGHPSEPTRAQNLGSALHVWALQRDLYEREVCVAPACDRRTKEGKAAYAAFEAASVDKIVLHADDAALVQPMSRAIGQHQAASTYRGLQGRAEVVIVWDDKVAGLCKGRIDKVVEAKKGWLRIDVKTTRCAVPGVFAKDCATFGYYTQDAFYRRGLAALRIVDLGERIIAVETNPPHAVEVFKFGPETRRSADDKVAAWLSHFARCKQTDNWPNLNNPEQEIEVPAWAMTANLEGEDEQ